MSYIGQTLPADSFQGFTTDSFTGDGSATTFTLSKTPFNESALLVVINNVVQKPTTNFTVSGTTLTIVGTAVASSDVIYATHIGGALPIGQAASLDLNGASDQLILDADADTTISADTDDQIDFKAGGTDIMSLTATTATFNDGVTITVDDNSDTLIVQSTDADASAGPNLILDRASGSPADDDLVGRITFRSRDDGGNAIDLVKTNVFLTDASDASEDVTFEIDQRVGGVYRNFLSMTPSEIVFNDDQRDIDFRVETNGAGVNALFLEGGSKRNGMFVSTADLGDFNELSNHSAGHFVNGDGSGGNAGITIFSQASANGHLAFADGTSGVAEYKGIIQYRHGTDDMQLYAGHTAHLKIASDGTLTGTDTDGIGSISSDQRLKENIQDYSYDISKFKTIKPRSFDWKFPDAHPYQAKVGFVAQELETVDSDWVITEDFIEDTIKTANFDDEKALLTDGKKKTTKLGKKDAMYISIIQQLITRIEALEDA
jgi:hypothetical protein